MAQETNAAESRYPVGSPFHFEMLFNPEEGFEETIDIDGKVVYNDGDYAIVKITRRYIEFDGVIHYFEETCESFPAFKPDYVPKYPDEYLWIDLSRDGFISFIPNSDFDDPEFEEDPEED